MVLVEISVLIIGVLIMLFAAEYAVRSSVKIAEHFRLSQAFIGLTILAIGTSFPEIFTHIAGSLHILKYPGSMNQISGLVLGTNIGADIFQQNFMLSLIAILAMVQVSKKNLTKSMGGLIGASLILLLASLNGSVSRLEGALLALGYLLYLVYLKKSDNIDARARKAPKTNNLWIHISVTLFAFIAMGFAAERVLDASLVLVDAFNISASFYGLIILGIAATMPEAITSLIALRKGRHAISAGILIGSNVTNPLFALGLGALLSGYTVPAVVLWYDLPVKIGTALALYWFLRQDRVLTKPKAGILLIGYLLYLIIRKLLFPADF